MMVNYKYWLIVIIIMANADHLWPIILVQNWGSCLLINIYLLMVMTTAKQ